MSLISNSAASAEAELADHSMEGTAILAARPSRLFRLTLLSLFLLLIAGSTWSFFGQADIIVTASGKLGPEAEERMIYTPITGQLVDLFVAEGTPVTAGDTLARLNSPGALQMAGQVAAATLKLQIAESAYAGYPAQRRATEQFIEAHKFQIATAERDQERRMAEWLSDLAEDQRIKLEKARIKVEKSNKAVDFARADFEKHDRLFRSAGGGGISRATVEEKRKEFQTKQGEYETAQTELAEFELKLNQEYTKKRKEIDGFTENLLRLRAQLADREASLANSENQTRSAVQMAQAELDSAAKFTVGDIDEDNMLHVKAPVAGIVTSVFMPQVGAKIEDKSPLLAIAPADARSVLHIEIPERERALLDEGMAVKVKFNAFPFQRYGFIEGTLEYIAPSATFAANSTQQQRRLIYKARVGIERDYFTQPGDGRPIALRFGMTAEAEIVVRRRRLIDLALDPLRQGA